MPQIRIEFYLLFSATAFHFYPSKPIIPFRKRGLFHLLKIPTRKFCQHILTCLFYTDIRNRDFQHYFFVVSCFKQNCHTGILTRYSFRITVRFQPPLTPRHYFIHRFAQLCVKIDRCILRTASRTFHNFPSGNFLVTYFPYFRIGRRPMCQKSSRIE